MELTMVIIVSGLLLFTAVFFLLDAMAGRPAVLEERVRRRVEPEDEESVSTWHSLVDRMTRIFRPLGEVIPRSTEEMSRQERRLVQAGIRRRDSAIIFNGSKLALAILLLAVFAVTGRLQESPFLYIVLPVLIGAMVPDLLLAWKIRDRKERIQLGIPDALDLTVVCVEAGLGLDQSLMRIGQEIRNIHPDLSDELRLMNLEVNAGKSRAQSMRNLASRTEVDDLRALMAVLIQTDRFGTSVAQSLRVFSDSLRTKRRQRAEERAAKTTIKMIPPLVLFILPAMFIVVLAPAIITLVKEFFPSLGN
jgi:tight adherence protein C